MGAELTAAIGLNSWASFAGTKGKAHIAGDIAMLEHEVNPVIKALRQSGLEVVAVHNHMLGDDPRMIFQPFFTTKPTGQGTGRWLSLSYDIITKGHCGELSVATEEGEWTEFTVVLPYVPIAKEPTLHTAPYFT